MWILTEASGKRIAGKYQYGDSGHAKKRAEKDYGGRLFWENELTEFIGKDESGKIWYRIKYRESNPMKKKRKGNPQRVTQAWLEKRVGLINSMLKRPETAYTETPDGLKSNGGHFYIDHAYGGVGLEMMSKGGGAHAISGGHVPKRELNTFLDGFIAAIREIQSSRVGNPGKRKAKAKKKTTRKKTTRKKNPHLLKQGEQLPGGKGRVLQYDNATKTVLVDRGSGAQPFVVWTIDPQTYETYWGHYYKKLSCAVKKFEEKAGLLMNPISSGDPSPYDGIGPHVLFLFEKTGPIKFVGKTGKNYTATTKRTEAHKFKTLSAASELSQRLELGKGTRVGIMKATQPKKFAQGIAKVTRSHWGKVLRGRNPVGPTQRELDSAVNLFKDFTGEHPERMQNVKLPVPKTGLVIGELDGVLYTTVRDGKTEAYQHDFKKGSRPLLASSHDGKSLHVLGGEYEFTERGIEDK